MVDRVLALPEGTRLYLLAPVVRGRKGEYRKELAEWQKAGFTRVRIDGDLYEIEEAPALDKTYKHDIEVRSEEHTSELQSLMRISYAVFCLKKTNAHERMTKHTTTQNT